MSDKPLIVAFCVFVIVLIVGLAVHEVYGHEPEPMKQEYGECK